MKAAQRAATTLKNAFWFRLHLPVEGIETDRERALAVQLENRRKFQQAFSQGLAVLGFSRDAEGNGIFELGSPTQAEWTEESTELRRCT